MKKSKLAIGFVALLAIGYVGSSWYVGNKIEKELDSQLININETINGYQNQYDISIKTSNYQKNIFTSKFHLTITEKPRIEYDVNEPKTVFDDDITIHHGPFPMAALIKGNFVPQLAWIEYEMTEKDNPTLWKLAGDKPFITATMGIKFSDYVVTKITTKALNTIDMPQFKEGIDISEGNITITSDLNELTSSMSVKLDKLICKLDPNSSISLSNLKINLENKGDDIVDLNSNVDTLTINARSSFPLQIDIDNISSSAQYTITFDPINGANIPNYQSKMNIEKLKTTVLSFNPQAPFVLNNIFFKHDVRSNPNNSTEGSYEANIESFNFGKQNLGHGEFKFNFEGVNTQNPFESLFIEQNASDFSKIQWDGLLNWHNASGDIIANTSAIVDNNLSTDDNNNDITPDRMLSYNIQIPFKVLARMWAQTENYNETDVTDDMIAGKLYMINLIAKSKIKDHPLISIDEDKQGIYLDLKTKQSDSDVIINGQKMNKNDFNRLILSL